MSTKRTTTPTVSQGEKFIHAARVAECDEDPAAFDAKMRHLAKAKPPAAKKAAAKKK